VEADLRDFDPPPADVVLVINVLRFLPLASQDALLRRLGKALPPGARVFVREVDAARGSAFRAAQVKDLLAALAPSRPHRRTYYRRAQDLRNALVAAGYTAFGQNGVRAEPQFLHEVVSANGTMLEKATPETHNVLDPRVAFLVTSLLKDVLNKGTGATVRARGFSLPAAGKTGTSRDGWFAGFTSNLVTVIWIGFDDNKQLGLTGAEAALPAWVDFMNGAIGLRPDLGGTNFACPEGIKFVEIDSATGLLSTLSCPLRELIAVTDKTAPKMECYLHGTVPVQSSPFAEESAVQTEQVVAQAKSRSRRDTSITMSLKTYRTTRVDVDSNGRHALVNDMR